MKKEASSCWPVKFQDTHSDLEKTNIQDIRNPQNAELTYVGLEQLRALKEPEDKVLMLLWRGLG